MSLKKILEDIKENQKIVSIFMDPTDWDVAAVGFVENVTDTHVCLRSLTMWGEEYGYEIRPLDEIFKVEIEGPYEKKLEYLLNKKESFDYPVVLDAGTDLVKSALTLSLNENVLVVIWGEDTETPVAGIVKLLNEDVAEVIMVDEFGRSDGVAIIDVGSIKSIDINTKTEQVRRFLWETNFKDKL